MPNGYETKESRALEGPPVASNKLMTKFKQGQPSRFKQNSEQKLSEITPVTSNKLE